MTAMARYYSNYVRPIALVYIRGLPYMASAKLSEFFTSPPVAYKNQLILFLLSAFWEPPPPWSGDVICGSPLTVSYCWTVTVLLKLLVLGSVFLLIRDSHPSGSFVGFLTPERH